MAKNGAFIAFGCMSGPEFLCGVLERPAVIFSVCEVAFSAAHRLHSHVLLAGENAELYGKCNNLLGHGHRYVTEATIGGSFDERSGTLFDLGTFQRA